MIIFALLLSATTTSSVAEAKSRARVHIEAGNAAFERSSFADAITAWSAAQRLVSFTALDYNVALAHEALAQPTEAAAAYERFLAGAEGKTVERATAAEKALENYRRTLARATIEALHAEIEVDGVTRGESITAKLWLTPGAHRVVLHGLEGGRVETITLRAGEEQRFVFTQEKADPAWLAAPPPPTAVDIWADSLPSPWVVLAVVVVLGGAATAAGVVMANGSGGSSGPELGREALSTWEER